MSSDCSIQGAAAAGEDRNASLIFGFRDKGFFTVDTYIVQTYVLLLLTANQKPNRQSKLNQPSSSVV